MNCAMCDPSAALRLIYSVLLLEVWIGRFHELTTPDIEPSNGPGPGQLFVLKINPGRVGQVVIYCIFFRVPDPS